MLQQILKNCIAFDGVFFGLFVVNWVFYMLWIGHFVHQQMQACFSCFWILSGIRVATKFQEVSCQFDVKFIDGMVKHTWIMRQTEIYEVLEREENLNYAMVTKLEG